MTDNTDPGATGRSPAPPNTGATGRSPVPSPRHHHGTRARRSTSLLLATCAAAPAALAQSPFAATVLDYRPAPGQFVQVSDLSDPARALGPPIGGGTLDGNDTKAVTLGGFGGSITLAFDRPVRDDPHNPLGLDCIVFGNAFWHNADPNRRWAEPATIEISRDTNHNGLADDPWYLIPGTHLPDPVATWQPQTWDDDTNDTTFPPSLASWLPPGESGTWQTWSFRLPADPFETSLILDNPHGQFATTEGIRGYADCSPTLLLGDLNADNAIDDPDADPAVFYTTPDNPFRVGVDPGSGGGDAFDIAWAIDPATGEPANLRSFDFIRITNATNALFGPFGERSAELCAVADVAPRLTPGDLRARRAPAEVRRP